MLNILKNKPIFIACDFSSTKELFNFLKKFKNKNLNLKIGLELFISGGIPLLKKLKNYSLFLDLKLHDIPNTVKKTISQLNVISNIKYLTVHLACGINCFKQIKTKINILGVSILTSLDNNDLIEIGFNDKRINIIKKMCKLAYKANIFGLIASVQDAKIINNLKYNLNVISPGIRLNLSNQDQKNIGSPKEAKENGCFGIVVGREITESENPEIIYNLINKILNE